MTYLSLLTLQSTFHEKEQTEIKQNRIELDDDHFLELCTA